MWKLFSTKHFTYWLTFLPKLASWARARNKNVLTLFLWGFFYLNHPRLVKKALTNKKFVALLQFCPCNYIHYSMNKITYWFTFLPKLASWAQARNKNVLTLFLWCFFYLNHPRLVKKYLTNKMSVALLQFCQCNYIIIDHQNDCYNVPK